MPDAPELVHATAIAHGDQAALIRGASGSGKSDLALRAITFAASPLIPGPVRLIADDYVELVRERDGVRVRAPRAIAGKLEVRGLGIVPVDHIPSARLALIVELVHDKHIERLPDPMPREVIAGACIPVVKLDPFECSAPAKLLVALARGVPPLPDA